MSNLSSLFTIFFLLTSVSQTFCHYTPIHSVLIPGAIINASFSSQSDLLFIHTSHLSQLIIYEKKRNSVWAPTLLSIKHVRIYQYSHDDDNEILTLEKYNDTQVIYKKERGSAWQKFSVTPIKKDPSTSVISKDGKTLCKQSNQNLQVYSKYDDYCWEPTSFKFKNVQKFTVTDNNILYIETFDRNTCNSQLLIYERSNTDSKKWKQSNFSPINKYFNHRFSSDHKTLCIRTEERCKDTFYNAYTKLNIYKKADYGWEQSFIIPSHDVSNFSISPDGKNLFIGSEKVLGNRQSHRSLIIYEKNDNNVWHQTFPSSITDNVYSYNISFNGQFLAVITHNLGRIYELEVYEKHHEQWTSIYQSHAISSAIFYKCIVRIADDGSFIIHKPHYDDDSQTLITFFSPI